MSITATLIIQMIVFLILVVVHDEVRLAADHRRARRARQEDRRRPVGRRQGQGRAGQRQQARRGSSCPRRATTPPSAWPTPSAWRQSMIEEAKGRASEEGAKIIAAARAEAEQEAEQGARGPARPGRRAGRQGRRADPAQGSQCRRARRPAATLEGRALRPWPNSPPSPGRTPRPCSRSRRRRAGAVAAGRCAGRRGRQPAVAPVRRQPEGRCGAGLRRHRRGGEDAAVDASAKNLLRTVIDNGRLAALPEIAAQFHALVNARSGVSRRDGLQRVPDRRPRSWPRSWSRWRSALRRKLNATRGRRSPS